MEVLLNVKSRKIAPVTALAAVGALAASMVVGGATPSLAAPSAPASSSAISGAHTAAPAVPEYYVALPGGNNFANVPGSRTAVVGDTLTGRKPLTIRAFGKDKFVTVSAAADDRTFVLGANPNPQPPAIPSPTEWYLVHLTPGAKFRATERKLRIPGPSKDDWVAQTAVSPNGKDVALLGTYEALHSGASLMWVRIYSAATGKLLHAWSGLPNSGSGGYTTLAWTEGGRQLAIGYTFALTPAGSKRSWPYLAVRLLNVASPGHNLTTDSRLAWSKLQAASGISKPTPLTCAADYQVTVSADGTVVCAGYGILRDYTPNPFAKTCPAVPDWAAVGFVAYSTATGKGIGPLYQEDTNCQLSQISVLWSNATGDTVIGYYSLGTIFATKPVIRFGVFSHGTYTQLRLPPTTTTVPDTIAW
jgi:hypothetical protein